MKAMILTKESQFEDNRSPLELTEVPKPLPGDHELGVRVLACGVCHTELDEIEGRTPPPRLPVIPGHQVVGRVESKGKGASRFKIGDRVGVAWINSACGKCTFCRQGNENLCGGFKATGRDVNGGYAEFMTVNEHYAYSIPAVFDDVEAAPLLCAGAIGFRSLKLSRLENGQRLGLTGFGASGHLVLNMAWYLFPESDIYVFARSETARRFALETGAVWAGDIDEIPPEKLSRIIDTTPAWRPVVRSLKHLEPGGVLVINVISKAENDKEELLNIDYKQHLWWEKEIKTVANVSRADVKAFLKIAGEINIKPEIREYPLEKANEALFDLKAGKGRKGANVLRIAKA